MKYMGSKNRIAKHILPIMLKDRVEGQYWVEPFVGGANMIDKVDGNRIGADINPYLIALFKGLQEGRLLIEDIPKDLYDKARIEYNNKTTKEFDIFELACIGYMGSANGRFYEGGYSGISNTKIGTKRNYILESLKNLKKQMPLLVGIDFVSSEYDTLDIPENSIIYADKPYEGTKQYSFSKDFNHDDFWEWCRIKSRGGHTVFISEYNAPEDFECIWSQEVKSSLSANGKSGCSKKSIEKLFTI